MRFEVPIDRTEELGDHLYYNESYNEDYHLWYKDRHCFRKHEGDGLCSVNIEASDHLKTDDEHMEEESYPIDEMESASLLITESVEGFSESDRNVVIWFAFNTYPTLQSVEVVDKDTHVSETFLREEMVMVGESNVLTWRQLIAMLAAGEATTKEPSASGKLDLDQPASVLVNAEQEFFITKRFNKLWLETDLRPSYQGVNPVYVVKTFTGRDAAFETIWLTKQSARDHVSRLLSDPTVYPSHRVESPAYHKVYIRTDEEIPTGNDEPNDEDTILL